MKDIKLSAPRYTSNYSIEEALFKRKSIRDYSDEAVILEDVSQLLWAVQGVANKYRTAPSAGATFPLEAYLIAGNVKNLNTGTYKYDALNHVLKFINSEDKRNELGDAALGQAIVKNGSAVIILTAVFKRTIKRYGERGNRYVYMEAGHAAQNLCLQATALNLGTVVVGYFNDQEVKRIIETPEEERPLYLIPIGRIK